MIFYVTISVRTKDALTALVLAVAEIYSHRRSRYIPMSLADENPGTANFYVTIPLATGIGVARNTILTRTALCLVAIGEGYGTLSEIAFGLQFEKKCSASQGHRIFRVCSPAAVRKRLLPELPGWF